MGSVKVAVLCDFPTYLLPGRTEGYSPTRHYATWLPQLASELEQANGLELHWITLDPAASKPEIITWKKQTFHILPTATTGRAFTLYRRDRAALSALLQQLRPDMVHGWGSEDIYGLAAVLYGKRHLVSMQGILSYYAQRTRLPARTYLQVVIELLIFRKAQTITVESLWGAGKIRPWTKTNHIELVEYGADPLFFETPWEPDPSLPACLFVGSISPLKGIQDLVDVYSTSSPPPGELWIAGNDNSPFALHLKKRATPNIKWLGRLTRLEVARALAKAWCLALPTRADTSPNVVKEARVMGLPVITTRCGGQTTYVTDEKNGFLIRPGDHAQLKDRLQFLLSDCALCRTMGACQQEEQRVILHPYATAKKFAELYRNSLT